ncbi:MAG: di-trans,poly-cis-decaprenylcistransferase [Candidatus Moranbacteria bacterium]|nr:di-trans,poly-cis-decaprenylcistransferase [Candidatus Moranbacteria bacterium]
MTIPNHVAIIPDANRRWAKQHNLKPWQGHEQGAKNLEIILKAAQKLNIKYLSFWGSSHDNLKKRPLSEKKALLDIYFRYFKKLLNSKEIQENQMKINVLGDWRQQFPAQLAGLIKQVMKKTKTYQQYIITFLLAYSGDLEMLQAIKNIAKQYKTGKMKLITQAQIKKNLYTAKLPAVDLLIRTGSGNDPHLSSGFLMWDTRDSQLYFSQKAWPEFTEKELQKAINQYSQSQRRFGG